MGCRGTILPAVPTFFPWWRAHGHIFAFVLCGWSGPQTENKSTGKAAAAWVSSRAQYWPQSNNSSLNITQLARDARNYLTCFLIERNYLDLQSRTELGYKLGLCTGHHATKGFSPKTSSSFVPYTDPGNIIFTGRIPYFSDSPTASQTHITVDACFSLRILLSSSSCHTQKDWSWAQTFCQAGSLSVPMYRFHYMITCDAHTLSR